MSNSSSNSSSGGMGLCSTLFIVFLVLKLCDVVQWSWWIVFMPLYIGFFGAIVLIGIVLLVALAQDGRLSSAYRKVKRARKQYKKDKDSKRLEQVVEDVVAKTRFEMMDVEPEPKKKYDTIFSKFSTNKSKAKMSQDYEAIFADKKPRFSLKKWWKEGNEKAAAKKAEKKAAKKKEKS